jgi:restriction endonuclease S subunit
MNATATKSEIKQFVINEGDVFITKDSETCEDIAIPAIATESLENVICGYHLAQFRTKEKIFLGSYLFRLFQSKSYGFRFVISAKGITRVGLGQSAIADSLTPVPPISEQRSIATYLDTKTAQCDRKIDLLTQKATQYGKLKQSLINETVTRGLDKSVPMKDIGVEWIGEVPEHWEIKRHKDNFIFVNKRCSDATFLKVGLENIESKTGQFLSTESEFDGDGIEFRENDILFGKLRPYLAKVYLAKFNGNAIGDIFVYRTKLNTQSKFANYLMLSSRYIDVMNSSTVGAKMPRVSSDFIANLIVATPPLSEQKAIADYLDTKTAQIDQIIQTINAQIEKLKELRKTLINDVVTGKIKVIDNGELKMDNY